jgi:hypothetical protein
MKSLSTDFDKKLQKIMHQPVPPLSKRAASTRQGKSLYIYLLVPEIGNKLTDLDFRLGVNSMMKESWSNS